MSAQKSTPTPTPAPDGATVPAECVECPRCHGTGDAHYYGHRDADCPQCDGEGQVIETRTCDECDEPYTGDGQRRVYWTGAASVLCPACADAADADPVNWPPVATTAPSAPFDWRQYQGRNVIPDGFGGWLAWRDATMATVPGYYAAKQREIPRRIGITRQQAAEMAADYAAMEVL